jgi:hypothetical protein
MSAPTSDHSGLRRCKLPLKPPVLLACSKCQRRLKHDGDPESITPLKKLLKRISKQHGTRPPTILKVPCLKLCPGGGLVVLTPQQLVAHECTILRTREDAKALNLQLLAARQNGAAKRQRRSNREQTETGYPISSDQFSR